jgi:DNA mismatch repair ATPase MutS
MKERQETLTHLLDFHTFIAQRTLKYTNIQPSTSDVNKVQEAITEMTDIVIPFESVKQLLNAHPDVKGNVAENGVGDTETNGAIASMISNILLGIDWPTYGDKFDDAQTDKFEETLKSQAKKLGWSVQD